MKRIIQLFFLLLTCVSGVSALPGGDWKVYPTFNDWHRALIETPNRVYIQTFAQPVISYASNYAQSYSQLFLYDKEADEIMGLSNRNWLSGTNPEIIAYNPAKKYLMVVFDDGNIDMLYDNGERVNIPDVVDASVNRSKKPTSITFDSENNLAYISTGFGYVAINDRTKKVASSLQTTKELLGAGRVGKRIIILTADGAYQAPADRQGLTEADFVKIECLGPASQLIPLTENSFAAIGTTQNQYHTSLLVVNFDEEGNPSMTPRDWATFKSVTANDDGYFIDTEQAPYQLTKDGAFDKLPVPDGLANRAKFTRNKRDYWICEGKSGLRSYRYNDGNWTLTHDFIRPSAPSSFMCEDIVWSDRYGAIAASHGNSRLFSSIPELSTPIASFKDGTWTDRSISTIRPDKGWMMRDAIGLAIDPVNPDRIVRSSRHDGLIFLDLNNPDGLMQISNEAASTKGDKGFFAGFSVFPEYPGFLGISNPEFDANGTLWVARFLFTTSTSKPDATDIYYWTAEDRKNGNFDGFKNFRIPASKVSSDLRLMPLKYGSNRNLLIFNGNNGSPFVVHNHGGTPGDTSDDHSVIMTLPLKDQDGSTVEYDFIHAMYEDPATGLVWVGTGRGLFTINPPNVFKESDRVARIKVSRNDGTNLADYLLNGISVTGITSDSQGRKWFSTIGAGLVCTSADGREILYQFTTDNSYIPDNNVYALCYQPATNSILISTEKGIAEYFPSGSASGAEFEDVKVYPNPVRPDYLGWITIDGLIDGSLVKIVDSMGGLVRELGRAEGGTIQWDATNLNYKRVGSGVYYVLASTTEEGKNMAKVAKILVVR